MEPVKQSRLHVIVDGRVQGVGFRYFVLDRALPDGITGWVRNTAAGQVEVTAEGSETDLQHLLDALRAGPRAAYVSDVQFEWSAPTGEFTRFEVRRTL